MIWAVAGLAVVGAAIVLWLVLARRRPSGPPVARDLPTTAGPGLGGRLAPSRRVLGERLGNLFGRGIGPAFWDGLEEALVAVDLGVAAATAVVARVRDRRPEDDDAARAALRSELIEVLGDRDRKLRTVGTPAVLVVVGVNGSGKTTTIAKLGALLEREGVTALLGAGDTFRAAASEQLRAWGERLGLDVVAGEPGADPASVAFDAFAAARARGRGAVVIDTAGRLHSKQNLMDELGKVVRVLRREAGDISEVLLVIDGTTGQNGIAQARAFTEAVGVTGVIVTKLDGTARGGIAVAIEQELGIPVKFIGVGESAGDLLHFDPVAFVDALVEGT